MTESSASAPPAAPASSGSTLRLIILIALLVGVVGMFVYDRRVAEPESEAAYDKLMEYVADQNAKGVADAKMVQSADVQAALGMAPTFVETKDKYTVEYYCWFGKVPVLNTWKRYLSVVYVGEPRRYDAHYKNQRPPADSLPDHVPAVTEGEGEVPEVDMGAEGPGGPPPDGAEEGGKKKGGKKKGGDAPTEETPAGDTPASDAPPATETPATETPAAETPAPATTDPAAPPAETPAEPAPAEPKAAEPPASEDKPEPEAPAEEKPE